MKNRILCALLALLLTALPMLSACSSEKEKEPESAPAPTFQSDAEHLEYVVDRFADALKEGLATASGLTVLPRREATQSATLTFRMDEMLLDLLSSLMGEDGEDAPDLWALDGSRATFTLSKDAADSSKLSLEAAIRVGETDVLSAAGYADRKTHEVLASAEPLTDGPIRIGPDNYRDWVLDDPAAEALYLFAAYTESVDPGTLTAFLNSEYGRLKALLPSFFTGAVKETCELTVEGVTQSFTAFRSTITSDAVFSVLKEWLKGAENNETLKSFLRPFYPALKPLLKAQLGLETGEDFEAAYGKLTELTQTLDERAAEIRGALPQIGVTVYADAQNDAAGFDLEISYFEQVDRFTLRRAEADGKYGFAVSLNNADLNLKFTSSGTKTNGRITGSCLVETDTLQFPFSVTDLSLEALKCGRIDGKISAKLVYMFDLLGQFLDIGGLSSAKSLLTFVGDVYFYVEGSGFYNEQNVKIAVSGLQAKNQPPADWVSLTIEYRLTDEKTDVTVDTSGAEIASLAQLREAFGISFGGLKEKLKEAGIPDEILAYVFPDNKTAQADTK